MSQTSATLDPRRSAEATAFTIIGAISFCHMLNDMMQSLITSIYPILKTNYGLDFAQVGLLTFVFQLTASLLQPLVGFYTDKRPMPYSLSVGMGFTFFGLILLAYAHSFPVLLAGAALIGMGSSVFHPESSRVARMASGGRHGLAQSLFQVGGNFGSAIGPLLAAFIVLPRGQESVAWFSVAALCAMVVLWRVGIWYSGHRSIRGGRGRASGLPVLPKKMVVRAIGVLLLLVVAKYIYIASLSSYYTFFLIHKFGVSVQQSQIFLFLFLGAVAAGTVAGGPIGDRFGRRVVIWFSILGVLPFTLMLPFANLFWTAVLSVVIGLILASAFSAILVFAQELVPGKVGMVAGFFFGFAFGIGGLSAALLGIAADHYGIEFVYKVCSVLPVMGILAVFLPTIRDQHA